MEIRYESRGDHIRKALARWLDGFDLAILPTNQVILPDAVITYEYIDISSTSETLVRVSPVYLCGSRGAWRSTVRANS